MQPTQRLLLLAALFAFALPYCRAAADTADAAADTATVAQHSTWAGEEEAAAATTFSSDDPPAADDEAAELHFVPVGAAHARPGAHAAAHQHGDLHLLGLATLAVILCALPLRLAVAALTGDASAPPATAMPDKRRTAAASKAAAARPFRRTAAAAPAAPPAAPRTAATTSATPRTDRPFRFRAPDMDEQEEEAAAPATAPDSFRVRSSRVVLDTSASPARLRQRQQQQQQQQQPVVATRDAARQQQQQAAGGWDPQLLAACAANQAYITSEEALQTSPLYVDHIRSVRGKQLSYERKQNYKLRVFKALRDVDPDAFKALFSRTDIREHDAVAPRRSQVAADWLLTTALTWACLWGSLQWGPWSSLAFSDTCLTPRLAHTLLVAWAAHSVWAVACGCSSVTAWLCSTYAAHGPYAQLAPTWRLLVALLCDAALTGHPLGCVLSLLWRLTSGERQSPGEWLARITPLREVVRPMPFHALPPHTSLRRRSSSGGRAYAGGSMYDGNGAAHEDGGYAAGGAFGSVIDPDEQRVSARLFDDY